MTTDTVVSQTSLEIAQTAALLKELPLRLEIEELIRCNQCNPAGVVAQMSAPELAVELAKLLVKNWPLEQAGFDTIQEKLCPLKHISTLLNSDEVNDFVRVRDDPCVLVDARMPLEDFKKALWQRLFAQ